MRTRRNLAIAVVLTLLLSTAAYAGTIDPDGTYTPNATTEASAMYTLEQIYNKVLKGDDPTGRIGNFAQPTGAPASTMYTLVDINGKIAAGTTTAVAGDVLDTKTFITRTTNGEAMATGNIATKTLSSANDTVAAGYYAATTLSAVDPLLTGSNIVKGVTIFGKDGTFTGLYGIPKTGAPKVGYATTPGEDGTAGNTKGTPASGAKYTISGDTLTVLDNGTGLRWVRNPISIGGVWASTMTWANAITNCAALNAAAGYGGNTDWRLPNVKELQSLVNYGNVSPAIGETTSNDPAATHEVPFTNTQSNAYWSSTTDAGTTGSAWYVVFYNGFVGSSAKASTNYVRPVRGG